MVWLVLRRLILGSVSVIALALAPDVVWAHDGGLWLASPFPNSTPQAVPASVRVLLPARVDPDTFDLDVRDTSGAQVDLGDAHLDPADPEQRTIVVSLRRDLPAGTYRVDWSARLAGDTHINTAAYTFTALGPSNSAVPAAVYGAGDYIPPSAGSRLPQVSQLLTALGVMLSGGLSWWLLVRRPTLPSTVPIGRIRQ